MIANDHICVFLAHCCFKFLLSIIRLPTALGLLAAAPVFDELFFPILLGVLTAAEVGRASGKIIAAPSSAQQAVG